MIFSALLEVFTLEVIVPTYPEASVTLVLSARVASVCQVPSAPRTRVIPFGLSPVSWLLWNRNSTRFASCGTVTLIFLLPAIVGDTE